MDAEIDFFEDRKVGEDVLRTRVGLTVTIIGLQGGACAGTYLERDAYLYPTRPRLERHQVIPNVPPPKPLVYDDVFEGRERDKVVRGGDREEGVAAVGFELDPEGGEDEEGFCG